MDGNEVPALVELEAEELDLVNGGLKALWMDATASNTGSESPPSPAAYAV